MVHPGTPSPQEPHGIDAQLPGADLAPGLLRGRGHAVGGGEASLVVVLVLRVRLRRRAAPLPGRGALLPQGRRHPGVQPVQGRVRKNIFVPPVTLKNRLKYLLKSFKLSIRLLKSFFFYF